MKPTLLFIILFVALNGFAQNRPQRIDSFMRALPAVVQDTQRAKIFFGLTDLYYYYKLDSFFVYCNKSIVLAKQLHMLQPAARLYVKMSAKLIDTGNYKLGLQYANDALKIDQARGSQSGIAEDYMSIGRVYDYQSDFVKSADYFFRAMTIARSINDHGEIALIGTNLGAAYFNQGDYKKAEEYSLITRNEAQLANQNDNLQKAYYTLAMIKVSTGDTVVAQKYYDTALAICKKSGFVMAGAEVMSDMAVIQKDDEKKISLLLQARAVYDSLSPISFESRINWQMLGIIYLNMYKANPRNAMYLSNALKYLTLLVDKSREANDIATVAQGLQRMAEIEELRGDYKLAYSYSKQYHSINDSIFSQDNKNKIATLQSREEVDKKNQEIAQQKRNALLLAAGLLVVGVVGFLFYRVSAVRKQQNKMLTQLNSELDKANKLKAKFFAILTHDLRSPVASLVDFLQLQRRKPKLLGEADKAEQEQKITDSATSLLGVMEEVLLWSKGQMDNFEPEKTEVYISDLFTYIHDFFSTVPHVQFNFNSDDNITVFTDENFLKTIMHNLTQNAVKALQNVPAATITWSAFREGDAALLSIRDNGPGIQAEQLKALYDDSSPIGSKHGLGLHIIRDLAKTIGCTISYTSTAGNGTQFNLTLPVK